MASVFGDNLGTNTKRGALIGGVALGLIALFTGGIIPMIIFGIIGATIGGVVGSIADPSYKKPNANADLKRQTNADDQGFRQEVQQQQEDHNLNRHDRYYRLNSPTYHQDRVRESRQSQDRSEGQDL